MSFRRIEVPRIPAMLLGGAFLAVTYFAVLALSQESALARLGGTVVDGVTGAPLGYVRVELKAGGRTLRATTDADGRFWLDAVPPGSLVLRTERAGYMGARLNGRVLPGSDGIPLILDSGQDIEAVLRVYPAAIVVGRVLEARGRPLQGMTVVPFIRTHDDSGNIVRRDFDAAQTNDMGEYRFNDLDTGDRFFRVEPPTLDLAQDAPGVYSPVYYPRSVEASRAEPVALPGGQETRLPDFTMQAEAGGEIRLQVIAPPATNTLQGIAVNVHRPGETASARSGVLTNGLEGTIGPLSPGSWEIDVLSREARGSASVVVGTAGTDLDVRMFPNAAVRGLAVIAGDPPRVVSGVRVTLTDPLSPLSRSREAVTADDGTFTFPAVGAGSHYVRVAGVPSGMYVQTVLSEGNDVLKQPLVVNGEGIDLVVTLGANAGHIDGIVVDSQAQTVPAAAVVLVPADRGSRHRARSVTALADGSFVFDNVAPGDYTMYAWLELYGSEYLDEAFMSDWEGRGTMVHIEPRDELTGRIAVLER